jgi:hypothetical protein
MTEKQQRESEVPAKPAPSAQQSGVQTAAERKLDVEHLDLTIEEVEERIAPSETNVFDK